MRRGHVPLMALLLSDVFRIGHDVVVSEPLLVFSGTLSFLVRHLFQFDEVGFAAVVIGGVP